MASWSSASFHLARPPGSDTLVSLNLTFSSQPTRSKTVFQSSPAELPTGCSDPATVSISSEALRKYLDTQTSDSCPTSAPPVADTRPPVARKREGEPVTSSQA